MLRECLEAKFGEKLSGKYKVASTLMDIFVLAQQLVLYSLVKRRPRRYNNRAYNSLDIRLAGASILNEKV